MGKILNELSAAPEGAEQDAVAAKYRRIEIAHARTHARTFARTHTCGACALTHDLP